MYIYIYMYTYIYIYIYLFIYLLDLTSGGGVFLCGPYCLRLCAFVRTRERARARTRARPCSYLGFRKFQSRVWMNVKLVHGP